MMALPDMVGYVVSDMRDTLAFYRLLGLEIPEGMDDEPYVEVITPNGYRLSWNTEEMTRQLYPEWSGGSGRITVAFKCASPAEVDSLYAHFFISIPRVERPHGLCPGRNPGAQHELPGQRTTRSNLPDLERRSAQQHRGSMAHGPLD